MSAAAPAGRMPDFLVIGAGKSGTTSLHHYLDQHPDVFLIREPRESNFFALEGTTPDFRGPDGVEPFANKVSITTLEAYRAKVGEAGDARAAGEKCPLYLYDPRAPENIRRHVPDVRLVAILRQPAERAWSAYLHARRGGGETLAFADALAAEPERIAANWGPLYRYRDLGFYGRQLERYRALFPADRIEVVLHDDLRADPHGTLAGLFRFLDVDPDVAIDTSQRLQAGGVPRSRAVHGFLARRRSPLKRLLKAVTPKRARGAARRRLQKANRARPALPDAERRDLMAGYAEDLERLEAALGRDLSAWRA